MMDASIESNRASYSLDKDTATIPLSMDTCRDNATDGDGASGKSDTESVNDSGKRMSVIELWRRREMLNMHPSTQPQQPVSRRKTHQKTTLTANAGEHLNLSLTQKQQTSHDTSASPSGAFDAAPSPDTDNAKNSDEIPPQTPLLATLSSQQLLGSLSTRYLSARRSHEVAPLQTDTPVQENAYDEKQTIQCPRTLKKQEARNRRANLLDVWAQREKTVVSPSQTTRRSPASVTSAFFDPEPAEMDGAGARTSDLYESPTHSVCHHQQDLAAPTSPQRRSLSVLDRWKKGMIHTDDFSSSQENSPSSSKRGGKVEGSPYKDITDDATSQGTFKARETANRAPSHDPSSRASVRSEMTSLCLGLPSNSSRRNQIISTLGNDSVIRKAIEENQKQLLEEPPTETPRSGECATSFVQPLAAMAAYESKRNATSERVQCGIGSPRSKVVCYPEPNELNSRKDGEDDCTSTDAAATRYLIQRAPPSVRRNLETSFSSVDGTNRTSGTMGKTTVAEGIALEHRSGSSEDESVKSQQSRQLKTTSNTSRKKDYFYRSSHLISEVSSLSGTMCCNDSSPDETKEPPQLPKRRTNVATRWTNRNKGTLAQDSRVNPTVSATRSDPVNKNTRGSDPTRECESKGLATHQSAGQLGMPGLRTSPQASGAGKPESASCQRFSSTSPQQGHENPVVRNPGGSKPRVLSSVSEDSLRLDYSQETVLSSRSDLSPPTYPSKSTILASSEAHTVNQQANQMDKKLPSLNVPKKAALYATEAMKLSNSCRHNGANQDFPKCGESKLSIQDSSLSRDMQLPSGETPTPSKEDKAREDHQFMVKAHLVPKVSVSPQIEEVTSATSSLSNSSFPSLQASFGDTVARGESSRQAQTDRIPFAESSDSSKPASENLPPKACAINPELKSFKPQRSVHCQPRRQRTERSAQRKDGEKVVKEGTTPGCNLGGSRAPARKKKGLISVPSPPNNLCESTSPKTGQPSEAKIPDANFQASFRSGVTFGGCQSIRCTSSADGCYDAAPSSENVAAINNAKEMHNPNSSCNAQSSEGCNSLGENASVGEVVAEQGKLTGKCRQAYFMKKSKLRASRRRVDFISGSCSVTPPSSPAEAENEANRDNSETKCSNAAAVSAQSRQESEANIDNSGHAGSLAVAPRSAPAEAIENGHAKPLVGNARFDKKDSHVGSHLKQPTCQETTQTPMDNEALPKPGIDTRGISLHPKSLDFAPISTAQLQEEQYSDSLSFFSHAGSAFSGYSAPSSYISSVHQRGAYSFLSTERAAHGPDSQVKFHSQDLARRFLAHPQSQNGANQLQLLQGQNRFNKPSALPTRINEFRRTGLASRYNTSSRFLDGEIEAACSAGADNSTVSSAVQSSHANSTYGSETSRSFDSAISDSDVYTTIDSYNSPKGRRGKRKSSKTESALQEGLSQAFQDAYKKLSNNVSGSVMTIDLRQFTSGLNTGVNAASESFRKLVDKNAKRCEETACSPRSKPPKSKRTTNNSMCDEGIAIEVEYVSDSEDDSVADVRNMLDQDFLSMASLKSGTFLPSSGVFSQDEATLHRSTTSGSLVYLGQVRLGLGNTSGSYKY